MCSWKRKREILICKIMRHTSTHFSTHTKIILLTHNFHKSQFSLINTLIRFALLNLICQTNHEPKSTLRDSNVTHANNCRQCHYQKARSPLPDNTLLSSDKRRQRLKLSLNGCKHSQGTLRLERVNTQHLDWGEPDNNNLMDEQLWKPKTNGCSLTQEAGPKLKLLRI